MYESHFLIILICISYDSFNKFLKKDTFPNGTFPGLNLLLVWSILNVRMFQSN